MAVALDPQLMDILACPTEDHAPLVAGAADDPDADVLTCTACGRRYPVEDGIPVLLITEALPPLDTALPPLDTLPSASAGVLPPLVSEALPQATAPPAAPAPAPLDAPSSGTSGA